MAALGEEVVTTSQLASLLGVTTDAVRKAVQAGRIVKAGRDTFVLQDAVRSYCDNLRQVAAGHGEKKEARKLTTERALLAREQREAQALKNAQSRGELVRADEVVAEWEDILSLIRANMLTTPIVAQQRLPHLSKHDVHVLGEVVRDLLTRSADDDAGSDDELAAEEGASGAETA